MKKTSKYKIDTIRKFNDFPSKNIIFIFLYYSNLGLTAKWHNAWQEEKVSKNCYTIMSQYFNMEI